MCVSYDVIEIMNNKIKNWKRKLVKLLYMKFQVLEVKLKEMKIAKKLIILKKKLKDFNIMILLNSQHLMELVKKYIYLVLHLRI